MIDKEWIGTGHWIFAGVSMLAFLVFLVWSYRKDLKIHRVHFKGSMYFTLALILIFFVIFIFKRIF